MTDGGLDRNGDFHCDKPDEELKRLEDRMPKICDAIVIFIVTVIVIIIAIIFVVIA